MTVFRRCRFCDFLGGNKVRYSTRHYAHPECGVKAKGLRWLDIPLRPYLARATSVEEILGLLPEDQRTPENIEYIRSRVEYPSKGE